MRGPVRFWREYPFLVIVGAEAAMVLAMVVLAVLGLSEWLWLPTVGIAVAIWVGYCKDRARVR